MNRKGSSQSSNDLLAYIKGNCKHLLGSAFWDVRYLCRVEAGLKPEKTEARILAISKFRIFFLSGKVINKLQVESNFHLLNLISIECLSDTQLVCGLEDNRRLFIRLIGTSQSVDLARAFLMAIKHYFPNCSGSLKLFLDLKPAQLYAEFASFPSVKPSLPCENFRRTYAALCDLYKYPFRDEVGWDVDKIYACHDNRVLRLEDFNHLNPRDLVPIVAVLQFNSWFDGLVIDNIKIHGEKELQDVLRDVLRRSQWLKFLRLSNCGLKGDFLSLLANAFQANPSLPLSVIDLSRNTFDDHKAAIQLGNSFSSLSVGVKDVFMKECGLTVKATNGIANGLFNSQLNASCLRKLSFAGNSLNHEVNDIHSLLSRCQILEELDLSNTGIIIDKLWTALKHGGLRLRVLKLSGCSFNTKKSSDPGKATALKDYFASAVALKCVDFFDCSLPSELLKSLLLGLACNQELSGIELNLSKSCLDRKCLPVLETSLPNVRAVTKLVLRDNGFDLDLLSLLPAVARMPCLDALDLGGNNFHGVRKNHPKQLTPILIELVKIITEDEGPLRELSLADCRLGVHLSVLLNALGPSPCLKHLDVSGNEMGNFGARLLAKALQINGSLTAVTLDKNQISVEGFADILHALKENRSLLSIPYPLLDTIDSVSRGEREKMQSYLAEIAKLLERNQSSAQRTGEPEITDKSYLTQSRLTLGNMEEELNRVEYASQQLLSECALEHNEPDVQTVQKLVEDAEKTKRLLVNMLPIFEDVKFVDELVDRVSDQIRDEILRKMKEVSTKIATFPEESGLSVCSNRPVFSESLVHLTAKKAQIDVAPGIADFKKYLRNEYSANSMAMANAVTGEVIKEVSLDLATASKKLGLLVKSSSLTSLNQPLPSPSSNANLTPKTKRKQRFFTSRSSRPKSIVDAEGISENLSVDMSSSDEFGVMNDSASSPALSLDEKLTGAITEPESNREEMGGGKLKHLQKARPRNPNKRMPTRKPRTDNSSDIDSGLSDFFGAKSGNLPTFSGGSPRIPLKQELLPTLNEIDESGDGDGLPPSPARAPPPGGFPVITAEMFQVNRKPLTPDQSMSPPRAPPNTPSISTYLSQSQGSSEALVPPKLPAKPKPKSHSVGSSKSVEDDEMNNGWVVLSESAEDKNASKNWDAKLEDLYAEIVDSESNSKSSDGIVTSVSTHSVSSSTEVSSVSVTRSTAATTESDSLKTPSSISEPISVSSSVSESSRDSATAITSGTAESEVVTKPWLPPKPDVPPDGLVRMRNLNVLQGNRPKTELFSGNGSGDTTEDAINGNDTQSKKDQRKSVMDLKGMFEKTQPPKPAPRSSKNKISPTSPSK